MSRKQFLKETMAYTEWRLKNNLPVHISIFDVDKFIRDKWIAEQRHDELIAYIVNEWDTGDFNTYTDFIEGYEQQLLATKSYDPFIKLWKMILKIRINIWWDYKKRADKDTLYKNIVSEKRQFLLDGLDRYIDGLLELRQEDELRIALNVKTDVQNSKKPKLNIG